MASAHAQDAGAGETRGGGGNQAAPVKVSARRKQWLHTRVRKKALCGRMGPEWNNTRFHIYNSHGGFQSTETDRESLERVFIKQCRKLYVVFLQTEDEADVLDYSMASSGAGSSVASGSGGAATPSRSVAAAAAALSPRDAASCSVSPASSSPAVSSSSNTPAKTQFISPRSVPPPVSLNSWVRPQSNQNALCVLGTRQGTIP